MSLVVGLSVVSEASILIFTFYWAPFLSAVFAQSMQASAPFGAASAPDPSLAFSTLPAAAATAVPEAADESGGVVAGVASSAARYLAESLVTASTAEGTAATATATPIPYMLIYATFMMSTMLGKQDTDRLHSMYTKLDCRLTCWTYMQQL
jgi:hypothetical protein